MQFLASLKKKYLADNSMWPHTKLTELLNITYPIIQAPMAGGYTTPELIANVCNAGGLGSLGAGYMKPDNIRLAIRRIRELTDKPFNVNLFIPEPHAATEEQIALMQNKIMEVRTAFLKQLNPVKLPYIQSFNEQIAAIIEEQVPVFSFTFGMLADKWIDALKSIGAIIIGNATNLTEAQLLASKDIDIIVAQGSEAGGHRGTFIGKAEDSLIGNFALLPQIADQINKPIVAAGGIMDGRSIVAALQLDASGVQMGTAFLSCPEAGTHAKFKELLLTLKQDNTTLTRAFSGKMARGLCNKFIAAFTNHQTEILDYPIQNSLTRPLRDEAAKLNLIEYMSLWAGQAAYLSRGITVDKLIAQLHEEVIDLQYCKG